MTHAVVVTSVHGDGARAVVAMLIEAHFASAVLRVSAVAYVVAAGVSAH